ncbi:MAG: hypothetical protein QNL04_06360 [SAR324 cluster bacterium]|nr:hypothetical protein [SAR324 cluster bacterium]
MRLKVLKSILVLGVTLVFASPNLIAGEVRVLGGTTISTQSIPLYGVTGMISHQSGEGSDIRRETTLYYHQMQGTKSMSKNGVTGDVTVDFKAIELDYFLMLPDFLGFSAFGPGIGYGIAETVETQNSTTDLSPFFTAGDIHYGVLLLKGQMNVLKSLTCDVTLNSFGGLIAGEFLCGLKF